MSRNRGEWTETTPQRWSGIGPAGLEAIGGLRGFAWRMWVGGFGVGFGAAGFFWMFVGR